MPVWPGYSPASVIKQNIDPLLFLFYFCLFLEQLDVRGQNCHCGHFQAVTNSSSDWERFWLAAIFILSYMQICLLLRRITTIVESFYMSNWTNVHNVRHLHFYFILFSQAKIFILKVISFQPIVVAQCQFACYCEELQQL